MPKLPMNYDNAVIYKIVCNNLAVTDCYVGSTTNFTKRKWQHNNSCNIISKNYNIKVYQIIRTNGGWNNWSMILVEEFPTTSKLLLEQRERYWIEILGSTLNCRVPTRTHKEWSNDHKEHLTEYQKQYNETNKEQRKLYYETNREHYLEIKKIYRDQHKQEIAIKKKQWDEINNTKFECACGCLVSKNTIQRHQQSNKHIKAIN